MAAGCAVLFITLSPRAIDFAPAPVSVYYLNVKMSVLVIAGSIKRLAVQLQQQTCREPRQADELLRRGWGGGTFPPSPSRMSSHSAGRHTGRGWLDKNRQWLPPPPPGTGLILIADTAAGNFQNNLQLQPCLPCPPQICQLFPPPPCLVPRHPLRPSSSIDNMDRRRGLWFAESEDPISPPLCVRTCRWETDMHNLMGAFIQYMSIKLQQFSQKAE